MCTATLLVIFCKSSETKAKSSRTLSDEGAWKSNQASEGCVDVYWLAHEVSVRVTWKSPDSSAADVLSLLRDEVQQAEICRIKKID